MRAGEEKRGQTIGKGEDQLESAVADRSCTGRLAASRIDCQQHEAPELFHTLRSKISLRIARRCR
jgi:hypothetical protein